MKIKINTLSPLLSASGESTALIDADVKYDKNGFPFIQAKTFKGLLRESAIEVCEILCDPASGANIESVNLLFGEAGKENSGSLSFNNLVIENYKSIIEELTNHRNFLDPEFTKNYLTESRQQTTMEGGIAKPKSLRSYRLIKQGTQFETTIENVPYAHEGFILNALLNLRYLGTRRNRGFGKIAITVLGSVENEKVAVEISPKPVNETLSKLPLAITTLDTLLIAKIFGEQNTVSTEKYIPAQNIRGLIAGLIINDLNLGRLAHENPLFKDIILSGNVIFNNAFLKGAVPIPNIYGYDKTNSESIAEFIFDNHLPLKGLSGMGKFTDDVLLTMNVETTFSFHNSRSENRLEGRSTEEGGAIFYYEGIAPNQTFTSELIGSKSNLEYIQSLLAQFDGVHRMGKSKTAQYSKVRFIGSEIADWKSASDKDVQSPAYLVFQSPVITYNQFGMAVPDLALLQKELESIIGHPIKPLSIASSFDQIENYMGVWQSKTPREAAFDIGTTLKIEFEGTLNPEIVNKIELDGLGERKSEGYGRVKVIVLTKNLERKTIIPDPIYESNGIKINPFDNPFLKEIFTGQIAHEALNVLKLSALKQASEKRGKLPNSLVSKLENFLMETHDFASWDLRMKGLKNKKAHQTLDGENLWDKISELKVPNEIPGHLTYSVQKSYWLAYFNALRIKQIKTKNNA